MDNQAKLAVFQAQVENVRELDGAYRQIHRTINAALVAGDEVLASAETKLLALAFCAWAEANFLKVILTPYGFEADEIEQIKVTWDRNGIAAGWVKSVDLGLRRVPAKKSGFAENAAQRLKREIANYVETPSQLRNKIAHGQWRTALNRENNALNPDLTIAVRGLTIVQVDIWLGCHRHLAAAVESLIESPERTFARDYWPQLTMLEKFLEESRNWSLAAKVAQMKAKKALHRAGSC